MTLAIRFCVLLAVLMPAPFAQAEWQAREKVETYGIAGTSGPELYASIGERGPKVGGLVRAIAHTSFKLTWTRKYVPDESGCTLVSARPKLIITYTLPKPSKQLPESTRENWRSFVDGVHKHELVHGDLIKAMVGKIEAASVGLSVPNDPTCQKIRTELTKRLGQISMEQRQQSRDFDRAELSNGGSVQQLILKLVNGQ